MTDDPATAADTTAATRLADEIRRRRLAAGLSQPALALRVGYTRQYVSRAERVGRNLPSQELVRALDRELAANGALLALRVRAKAEQRAQRSGYLALPPSVAASSVAWLAPTAQDGVGIVAVPGGRFFAGSTIPSLTLHATYDGRVVASPPTDVTAHPVLRRPARGLVIGAVQDSGGMRCYALDSRRARVKLGQSGGDRPLLIPPAYELDDLTLGILWAVTNLDDALLDDDGTLADHVSRLAGFEQQHRSSGGSDLAADLTAVSRMWLGSDFCARHILRHSPTLSDAPVFWTREQRGEEASTWLLFAHKYAYLRDSTALFGAADQPSRSFCIPRRAVADSPAFERALLFLAAALIESFGVRVEVCAEPEYGAVQGFAVDQRRRAIVANWVGTDGVWQVDVTDSRPLVREFADAGGYARAHSVIAAPDPAGRLRALADYLELDWSWLHRRCSDLAEYGTAGLAQPRSRLLSLAGLDQACTYVADLDQTPR